MIQEIWSPDIREIPIHEGKFWGKLKDYEGYYVRVEEVEIQDIYDKIEEVELKLKNETKRADCDERKQHFLEKYTYFKEELEKGNKFQLIVLKYNPVREELGIYDGRHRLQVFKELFGSQKIPVIVLYDKGWAYKNMGKLIKVTADNTLKKMKLLKK